MKLTNDRTVTLTTAGSRKATYWSGVTMKVSELYERLRQPQKSTETMQEYLHLKKSEQDELKDVGGFVGGTFEGHRRKADKVTGRDLITLDFDNVPGWGTNKVREATEKLGCSFCIYSTRKHTPDAPRLRIVIPLDRTVTADEYEPIARWATAQIGIGMADPTTFEASRLMYWPSCCSDSKYYYQASDGPLLNADFILYDMYDDWKNMLEWPQHPNESFNYQKEKVKQEDPTTKQGPVGIFCRTYDIYQAMEKFLPGIYSKCDNDEHRFTYLNGSTTGGVVVYEDGLYLYSHHATDPCSRKLVNAFDMVRLHKFGALDKDKDPETPVNRLPSYTQMVSLASSDDEYRVTEAIERERAFRNEFDGLEGTEGPAPTREELKKEVDWQKKLKYKKNGERENTIDNCLIIMENDPELRDKFAYNEFAGRGEALGPLPWDKPGAFKGRRLWSDTDNSGLYWYLEKKWGLSGRGNIDAALDVHTSLHSFNDVQNYLKSLKWDGVERLDSVFIDYLSAADTEYTRTVTRKSLIGAVARAMEPGCKFDNMVIFTGPQGAYKSSLLQKLSRGWFNDSIRTFEGKEASELLRGVWIVEIQELDAFRKSDAPRIKQFLSIKEDRYRAAYGRHVKAYKRSCVFFGTTNAQEFLQDMTGNRRFWPIKVGPREEHVKNVFTDLTDYEIDQIWAEAYAGYYIGEDLYLSGELESMAIEMQESYRETSDREGMIFDFVEQLVPENWSSWDLDSRRNYWAGSASLVREDGSKIELVERQRICASEIWCELFNGRPGDLGFGNSNAREINTILGRLSGWEKAGKTLKFGKPYGSQRGYLRKGNKWVTS